MMTRDSILILRILSKQEELYCNDDIKAEHNNSRHFIKTSKEVLLSLKNEIFHVKKC